eukprot:4076908-Amphidinium_carterae.2
MQPTWNTGMNNRDFIKTFTTWRERRKTQTELTKAVKASILLNTLSGPVKDHLLLSMNVRDLNFDAVMQTVEDYYWSTYIDNEQRDMNAFKGKYNKEKLPQQESGG